MITEVLEKKKVGKIKLIEAEVELILNIAVGELKQIHTDSIGSWKAVFYLKRKSDYSDRKFTFKKVTDIIYDVKRLK